MVAAEAGVQVAGECRLAGRLKRDGYAACGITAVEFHLPQSQPKMQAGSHQRQKRWVAKKATPDPKKDSDKKGMATLTEAEAIEFETREADSPEGSRVKNN